MKTRYLVTGASGQLGSQLIRILEEEAVFTDLPEVDITDPDSVYRAVKTYDPRWIINCAAVTDVDQCERDPGMAMKVHRDGPAILAGTGRRLLTISTDHVFTGDSEMTEPFTEEAETCPANVYGKSKLAGERAVLKEGSGNIVVRTSWLFSRGRGLIPRLWRQLTEEGMTRAVRDQRACFTYAPDLARSILRLIRKDRSGIYHIVNSPGMTPREMASGLSEHAGGRVEPVEWTDLNLDAPRPVYSVLGCRRSLAMPDIWNALKRWRNANELD